MCRQRMYRSCHQNQQKNYYGRGLRGNTCRGDRSNRESRSCTNYQNKSKKQNLLKPDGKPSKYAICGFSMHQAKNYRQRKLRRCIQRKYCYNNPSDNTLL